MNLQEQSRTPDVREQLSSARKAPPPASPSAGALSQNAVSNNQPELCKRTHMQHQHFCRAQVGLLQAAVFESGRCRPAVPTPRELNQQLTGGVNARPMLELRLTARSFASDSARHCPKAQPEQHQGSAGKNAGATGTARATMQAECCGEVEDAAADQAAAPRCRARQPQHATARTVSPSR
jgi:hypothetical protein